ncbi:hypothetical protein CR513_04161, partial [Mucuna pruriens]
MSRLESNALYGLTHWARGCFGKRESARQRRCTIESWDSLLAILSLMIMVEDKVVILGPNELPNLVCPSRLDNRNYLQWAQYIRTLIKGRKKLSYIEGSGSPRDDPKFEACDDEDSLIMIWLWNSMTLEISRNYMFYSSVHEI